MNAPADPREFTPVEGAAAGSDPQSETLFAAERKALAGMSDAALLFTCNDLANRYRKVLPLEAERNLAGLDAPDMNGSERRELASRLFDWLDRYYHFVRVREEQVGRAKTRLALGCLGILLLGIFVFVGGALSSNWGTYLIVGMMGAGMLGAMFSIIRRMQGIALASIDGLDADTVRIQLCHGKWGVFIALASGCIFPMVLYLVFASGLLGDAGLIPVIEEQSPKTQMNYSLLSDFVFKVGPASSKDAALILLWSFLAGFAERLVPDVLDRVASKVPS